MFMYQPRNIDEDAFCREYKEKEKKYLDNPNYETAVDLIRISPEEYSAFLTLRSTLTSSNYLDQLNLTSYVINKSPNSYTAWEYRKYLMTQNKILGKVEGAYLEDTYFLNSVLEVDSRNMHAWMHIAVVHRYPLNTTQNGISKSVSNYSAYFGSIQNGGYSQIQNTEIEGIVFADPEISSPWVFIRMKEVLNRLNGKNAYVRKYRDRLSVVLRNPGRTRLLVQCRDSTVQYSVEYKKEFSLYWEREKYAFDEIQSISVRTAGQKEVKIDLAEEYSSSPPEFIDRFIKEYPTVEAYITKLSFHLDSTVREETVRELVKIDPKRSQMYLEMKEEYSIYRDSRGKEGEIGN